MSLLLAALLIPQARAAGTSADVELLRPSFSAGGPAGVDTPWIEQGGVIRAGTLLQYERDPLVLYEYERETGTVITHRWAAHVGAAVDLGRGASARVALPAAVQWGSQVPALASDGPGLGDLRAGLRLVPPLGDGSSGRAFRAGLRLDLALPTGTPEAWLGESTPRLHPGVLLGVRAGAFESTAELGIEARTAVDTGQDFALGTEAVGGLGLRWVAWPDKAAITTGLVARGGLNELFSGGAENSAEVLSGLQLWPGESLQLDLGLGKGLTEGYGTSELRVLASLTWIRRPPPPAPPPLRIVQVDELEDLPAEEPPPPPPEEDWEEGELARVEETHIVIREPIQFAYATDRILPESRAILAEVARLLNEKQEIGHLVIEGHASEEGSFTYNYELSVQRARAVWEALLAQGVHYLRVSYRGLGEVVPVVSGTDEASLARNRRVEFRIVHRRQPEDPLPPSGPISLPWSGVQVQTIAPPVQEPTPEPPPQPRLDEWGDPIEEEE